MGGISDKIEELRAEMQEAKKMAKSKRDASTDETEQLFWVNVLIEIKDIDYRLYDIQQTLPKYEE